jgi:hypothetical protein
MAKKFKHRLVIETTFDKKITETEAYHIIRSGLHTNDLNGRVAKYFSTPKAKIRNLAFKRWSRVMAHIIPKEIVK